MTPSNGNGSSTSIGNVGTIRNDTLSEVYRTACYTILCFYTIQPLQVTVLFCTLKDSCNDDIHMGGEGCLRENEAEHCVVSSRTEKGGKVKIL